MARSPRRRATWWTRSPAATRSASHPCRSLRDHGPVSRPGACAQAPGRSYVRKRVVSLMQVQITEQIRADVNSAMKAGDRGRAAALRLVLSELQKDAKEGAGDELAVLRRERKRRREAETAYREAERGDLAESEAYEASIIEGYLPAELPDADLDALVALAIAETGAES